MGREGGKEGRGVERREERGKEVRDARERVGEKGK